MKSLPSTARRGATGRSRPALSSLKFTRRLRKSKFDLVIDLQGLFRTGMMCLATGAKRIVGFASVREGCGNVLHRPHRAARCRSHPCGRPLLARCRAAGARAGSKQFHVHINAAARPCCATARALAATVAGARGRARWETKRWPPENFAAVAKSALSRFGGSVIFIGTKDEGDVARKVNLAQPALDLCGKTTLPQLAAVLERADAVVANDTGPLHLAAALGRPTVAPYTCTLVTRHGPYGQAHRTASATVDCHGSYRKKCDHFSCMPTVPAARLSHLLDEVLSGWVTRRPA